jgi:hypothetical protein
MAESVWCHLSRGGWHSQAVSAPSFNFEFRNPNSEFLHHPFGLRTSSYGG